MGSSIQLISVDLAVHRHELEKCSRMVDLKALGDLISVEMAVDFFESVRR
jgi:hypothetical protein